MANLTRIKILTTGATTSAPSNIKTGELAYSYVAGTQANNGDRLYIGTGTESGGVASSVDLIGGKYFVGLLDHVHGTTTASSALIVDANKHVSDLNIGSLALEASGGSGQVVNSIVTTMPGSPTNAQLITAQAAKTYIDAQVTAQDLDFQGDTGGALSIDLDSESLTIAGGTGLSSVGGSNTVTLNLDNTSVTAATYGSATQIPQIAVDAQGRITAASNIAVATGLTIGADAGSNDVVSLITDVLNFSGDTGITTTVSNNTITIDMDDTAVTAASYGTTTAIPVITIDQQGRITNATTATIATTLNLAADSGTDDGVALLTDTLTISGTTDEIETSVSGDTITVGLPSNVTVSNNLVVGGNLTVTGTQTQVNTVNMTVTDPVIELANDLTADDSKDKGIKFKWWNGSAVKQGFFGQDVDTNRFVFKTDMTVDSSEDFSAPWGDAEFGTIYGTGADLGNVTVGIATDQTITTVSGDLVFDSHTNEVVTNANLTVNGDVDITGTVTLTNDLAVAHGGTGVSSFTGKGVFVSNAAGTALSQLTSSATASADHVTNGDIIQFSRLGVPMVSNLIDGGTY